MAFDIKFKDNRVAVNAKMSSLIESILLEVAAELQSQTARNTKVDTGQTKNSWAYKVNAVEVGESVATIGSPLMNAVYEEFGTGEYALNGNGRKGGWFYVDEKGKGHFTHGKKPRRPFFKAYTTLKPRLIRYMQDKFQGGMTK